MMDITQIKNYLKKKANGRIETVDLPNGNKKIRVRTRDDDDNIVWVELETNAAHLTDLIEAAQVRKAEAIAARQTAQGIENTLTEIKTDLYG